MNVLKFICTNSFVLVCMHSYTTAVSENSAWFDAGMQTINRITMGRIYFWYK